MDAGRKAIYAPIAQVEARGRGSQETLQARAKEKVEDWEHWEARREVDLKEGLKEEKATERDMEKDSAGRRVEAKAVEAKAGRKADASFAKDRTMRISVQLRQDR